MIGNNESHKKAPLQQRVDYGRTWGGVSGVSSVLWCASRLRFVRRREAYRSISTGPRIPSVPPSVSIDALNLPTSFVSRLLNPPIGLVSQYAAASLR